MKKNETYNLLIKYLDTHKARYRIIDHAPEGRTDIVSPMRGNKLSQAAKCMVLAIHLGKKDTKYVLGIIPGDKTIDFDAVKSTFGASYVSFAPPQVAEKMSGSVVGTVLPFSFNPQLELVVDPMLLENTDELFFNAARLDRSLALNTQDYQSIVKPRLESIAKREEIQKKATPEKEALDHLRHSCAHLLAAAVMEIWPKTKPTLGPPIENGFYYDFDFGDVKVSEDDLPKIEEEMKKIVKSWDKFTEKEVSPDTAKEFFKNNEYKIELIEEFSGEGKRITFHTSGTFTDLCRGGHTVNPKKDLKHFKLLSVAGAYWRGSEKNKMLTRIYGTCFRLENELSEHLKLLEKAKLNDHRKLGKELELFAVSDEVGPGLILWLPKGNVIKEQIETWAKQTEEEWGYKRVTTPNITKAGLYYTSGHLPYYREDMYPPMKLTGEEEYFLKPMNCPHHHMVYKSRPRSYRELPLRLAEYGVCYRYEASGQLFGLMRVRGFAQNDSHIYCQEETAVEEFVNVMKLHEYYYKALGIKEYYLELALRDQANTKKYHGNEEMWKKAEKLMREAVSKVKIPMVEQIGNAAFYGPKIDFIVKSSIGREFAISTNQIDLFMGDRFGLKYIDRDGREKTPVIIHRAPLGSHERFIGFLIEHFGGDFPLWMSPIQVKLLPVTERNVAFAQKIAGVILKKSIRAELDDKNEPLGAKIRNAQNERVPYILVVGDKEEKGGTISVRTRGNDQLITVTLKKFLDTLSGKIKSKALEL